MFALIDVQLIEWLLRGINLIGWIYDEIPA